MAAITDLTTLAVADVRAGDYLPIYDASAGTDKKTPLFAQGSWTPVLNFGGATTGITYSGQSGNYVRVGALVYVEILIILTNKGSATGAATITGLPFTSAAAAAGMNPRYYINLASMVGAPFGYISGTTIFLWQMGATSLAVLTNSNFANNTRLDMWGMYYA